MQQVAERCQSKNMEPSGHYSPAQPIQVECMSSLCSLWCTAMFYSTQAGSVLLQETGEQRRI